MPTRLEKIRTLLLDEPHDQFLRYSLAMELDKAGEHEGSLATFAELAGEEPPYVAAFFMAAQQLARLERIREARERLRAGIEAARAVGDGHAAGEMAEFLAALGSAGE